jgi:hypothetical protein
MKMDFVFKVTHKRMPDFQVGVLEIAEADPNGNPLTVDKVRQLIRTNNLVLAPMSETELAGEPIQLTAMESEPLPLAPSPRGGEGGEKGKVAGKRKK